MRGNLGQCHHTKEERTRIQEIGKHHRQAHHQQATAILLVPTCSPEKASNDYNGMTVHKFHWARHRVDSKKEPS